VLSPYRRTATGAETSPSASSWCVGGLLPDRKVGQYSLLHRFRLPPGRGMNIAWILWLDRPVGADQGRAEGVQEGRAARGGREARAVPAQGERRPTLRRAAALVDVHAAHAHPHGPRVAHRDHHMRSRPRVCRTTYYTPTWSRSSRRTCCRATATTREGSSTPWSCLRLGCDTLSEGRVREPPRAAVQRANDPGDLGSL
jgi:hypothetical protein